MSSVTAEGIQQPVPAPAPPPPGEDGRALYIHGLMALRDGDAAQAASLLTRALQRQPDHPGMRRNLVRALLAARQFGQALPQAEVALAAAPDDAEMHFACGTALNALGRPAAACVAFNRAVMLQPHHAPSWLNYGNASADLDQLDTAEALYRCALRLDPALPEAHASLAYVLTLQGRLVDAITACDAAIHLHPDFAQAQWNKAIATLLSGDLADGFALYEWRKRHPAYCRDFTPLPGPQWDGGDPAGRTILVRAEQGMGDAIQFARFLPEIRRMGGRPVLVCAPALVPLIGSLAGVQAVPFSENLPAYDAWIDQMSLPRLLGTSLSTIPAAAGYFQADPARMQAWRQHLPAGRKVGIVLAGNPRTKHDRRRSVPAADCSTLPSIPGISFVNLHHGPTGNSLGVADLTPLMTDYAETAALIGNLDLVISVDTSVAHLAGAMGKPVFLLLPFAPDWRWLLHREDSPWYQSVRLFRQTAPGAWSTPLQAAFDALRQWAA